MIDKLFHLELFDSLSLTQDLKLLLLGSESK